MIWSTSDTIDSGSWPGRSSLPCIQMSQAVLLSFTCWWGLPSTSLVPRLFITRGKRVWWNVFNFGSYWTYVMCCDTRTIALFVLRVHTTEFVTSPRLQVHLAEFKQQVLSWIACWAIGNQSSLSSFKSLSQSFQACPWRKHHCAIWLAVLPHRTKIEYAFNHSFSACDKEAGHETTPPLFSTVLFHS